MSRPKPVTTILLATIIAVTSCGEPSTSGDGSEPAVRTSSTAPALPPDLGAAGFDVSLSDAVGTITAEQAALRAEQETGDRYADGSTEAYLVTLTDDGTSRSDEPTRDRVVWLFHYSGLVIPYSGPMLPDGTPAEGGLVTDSYVVIDAFTGNWIYTTETG